MTIYLKKTDGMIEQYEDDMQNALNIEKELQGESFGTIYTAESLPDEDKLSLGLITQLEIDNKIKQKRISEIKMELSSICMECIRPLMAESSGKGEQADRDKIIALENRADVLRSELKALGF